MSSVMNQESQLRVFSPQNNILGSQKNNRQDSQRNTENDNQIANSICNSVNNLTPMKVQKSERKISVNQLSVSRTDNMIIQCQICENIDDINLIQPCQCENFYHQACFKKKLQANTGQFNNEIITCSICGNAYKIRKMEKNQQQKFSKATQIISFIIQIMIIFGCLSGLSYWFYIVVQEPEEMSSLIAIIALLMLLLVLYLVYLLLELFRGNIGIDWEILDQKQEINQYVNPDELNLIENRQNQSSQKPQVIQHIANIQYPQISTSEIIQ